MFVFSDWEETARSVPKSTICNGEQMLSHCVNRSTTLHSSNIKKYSINAVFDESEPVHLYRDVLRFSL